MARSCFETFSIMSLISCRPFSRFSRYDDFRNRRATESSVVSLSYDDSCCVWPIKTNELKSLSTLSICVLSQFLTSLSFIVLRRRTIRSRHYPLKAFANSGVRVLFKFLNGFSSILAMLKGIFGESSSLSKLRPNTFKIPLNPPMSAKY